MPHKIVVILDDRIIPPSDVVATVGPIRFSQILRRRKRLEEELQALAHNVQAGFQVVESSAAAHALAAQIDGRISDFIYIWLPSCFVPLYLQNFELVIQKAAFALETTFIAPLTTDVAALIATPKDAAALLRADDESERRDILVGLSEYAETLTDQLEMLDLRKSRNLFRFLVGSTEARHFNSTKVTSGIFYKNSSDVKKMRAEYMYFQTAPEATKRFLLPTFDFWEDKDQGRAGYAMEHLAMPDVALQFIHGAIQPDDFALLLDNFFNFLQSRTSGEVRRSVALEESRKQILDKLNQRLESFLASELGQKLDAMLVLSGPRGGLRSMQAAAQKHIEKALNQAGAQQLVFGHGDPCFSNILFDGRLGFMRLIDPKGAMTFQEGLMNPLYDVAKFSHSVMGGYDFINNGLFRCCIDEKLVLNRHLDKGGPPTWAQAAFLARLKDANIDPFCVRAVELSLFLSMLPLHSDRPDKLVGFALTAATILDDLEKLY